MLPWSLEHRVFAYDSYMKNGESVTETQLLFKQRFNNIQKIGEEILVKVKANFRKQLQICARENGHHLSDLIFCS